MVKIPDEIAKKINAIKVYPKQNPVDDVARNAAREFIRAHAQEIFEKWTGKAKTTSAGKPTYICPICRNGAGEHGDGIAWNPNAKSPHEWKCFSADCNFSGDVISYWIRANKLDQKHDFPKAIKQIADFMGWSFPGVGRSNYSSKYSSVYSDFRVEESDAERKQREEIQAREAEKKNHKHGEEINTARKHVFDGEARAYLEKRGITDFDKIFAPKYNIGFLKNWRCNNGQNGGRLIIPTGKFSYYCRDTRDEIPESQKKWTKVAIGSKDFFNKDILWEGDSPVFVVEGEIDALSLIDAGSDSVVSLGSVSMWEKFARMCIENPPANALIIALDNDSDGKTAAQKLSEKLSAAGIENIAGNICGEYNDPNERLQHDRAGLIKATQEAEIDARLIDTPIKKNDSDPHNDPMNWALPPDEIEGLETDDQSIPDPVDLPPGLESTKHGVQKFNEFVSRIAADSWLIDRWIPAGGLSMIFGDSGAGKSFVALDMALTVATGSPKWHGKRVKRGAVVYIAGEGVEGLRKRSRAWKQFNDPGDAYSDPEIYYFQSGALLDDDKDFQSTIDDLKIIWTEAAIPIEWVIVDTMARSMKGDENSTQEAGELIRSCGMIQNIFGCAVTLIHHTGVALDAKNRSRGSSAILGALDTQIKVEQTKPDNGDPVFVTLIQRKQKEIFPENPLKLDFESVILEGIAVEDPDDPDGIPMILSSIVLKDHVETESHIVETTAEYKPKRREILDEVNANSDAETFEEE